MLNVNGDQYWISNFVDNLLSIGPLNYSWNNCHSKVSIITVLSCRFLLTCLIKVYKMMFACISQMGFCQAGIQKAKANKIKRKIKQCNITAKSRPQLEIVLHIRFLTVAFNIIIKTTVGTFPFPGFIFLSSRYLRLVIFFFFFFFFLWTYCLQCLQYTVLFCEFLIALYTQLTHHLT